MNYRKEMYSDEVGFDGDSRRQGVSIISGSQEELSAVTDEIEGHLEEKGMSSLEWKDLSGVTAKRTAKRILTTVIDKCINSGVRVDVLTWSLDDSRHSVPGRDELQNLRVMYYHAICNVMREHGWYRWKGLYPDQHTAIDWETEVATYLRQTSVWNKLQRDERLIPSDVNVTGVMIKDVKELDSKETPSIQAADLFAGLAHFSHEHYGKYALWKNSSGGKTTSMFGDETGLSNSEEARAEVVDYVNQYCKSNKLGVSLETEENFRTWDPSNPVNFWNWESQRPEDTAPLRE